MKTYGLLAVFAGGLLSLSPLSLAQDIKPVEAPVAKPVEPPPAPTWTDPEFEKVAAMVTGSWKSTSAVPTGEGDATSEIVLSAAPVVVKDVPNAMYVEIARADGLRVPYRQEVLAFNRVGGKVRMTVFEFRRPRGDFSPAYTMWAAPEAFPATISRDDLVATLAFDLTPAGNGYSGKTPHAYPTGTGGAVEMTSEFKLAPGKFELADRGMGADGKQVWGPAAGQLVAFASFDPKIKVYRLQDGLMSITYPTEVTGAPAAAKERITLHYAGHLQTGLPFDSSYERGQPFTYTKGDRLVEGWGLLMDDIQAGMARRLIIPGRFAYGEQGRRPNIPANATLVFDIEALKIEPALPPPAPALPPQLMETKPGDPAKPADPTKLHDHKDGEPHPK